VDLDDHGFVLSGEDYVGTLPRGWPLERSPYRLETRLPGVFVAGDARRGAVNRIVVAAGEGAIAVQFTHHYFRDTPGLRARTTEPREPSKQR
jgi:thioredoxin reductase (NADPH)